MKTQIIAALNKFISQRPGLEFGNYGERTSYFAEVRSITKDLHHARTLLTAVSWRHSITAEDIIEAAQHAYSGRLSIVVTGDNVKIAYCTGQYFPTEYRKAVCAVLSSVLWDNYRDDMPLDAPNKGDSIRSYFRREFGRGIASRYFN